MPFAHCTANRFGVSAAEAAKGHARLTEEDHHSPRGQLHIDRSDSATLASATVYNPTPHGRGCVKREHGGGAWQGADIRMPRLVQDGADELKRLRTEPPG